MNVVGVVISVAVAVIILILRSKIGEKVSRSCVGVVNRYRTAIYAVVVTKTIAIGIQGLLPIALELVTVVIGAVVVRPTVLVEISTPIAVNP